MINKENSGLSAHYSFCFLNSLICHINNLDNADIGTNVIPVIGFIINRRSVDMTYHVDAVESTVNIMTTTKSENENVIICTTITRISVRGVDDNIRYRVSFLDAFQGKKRVGDDIVDGDIDYVDFTPSVLIAIVLNSVPGVDIIYTKAQERAKRMGTGSGFGAAELNLLLRDAEVSFERTHYAAGSEYTTSDGGTAVHEHDGWNTTIVEIAPREEVQRKLDELTNKLFDNLF